MPDNTDKPSSQREVMERLLAKKKQAGPKTPQHAEFKDRSGAMRAGQVHAKPQKPGGNRGRG